LGVNAVVSNKASLEISNIEGAGESLVQFNSASGENRRALITVQMRPAYKGRWDATNALGCSLVLTILLTHEVFRMVEIDEQC